MTMQPFEMEMTFSLLSFKPVLFGDEMCYWRGLFMHRHMALSIASVFCMHNRITQSQKVGLKNLQIEAQKKGIKLGMHLPFDLTKYSPDQLFSFLFKKVYDSKANEGLQDWIKNPHLMLAHFFDD